MTPPGARFAAILLAVISITSSRRAAAQQGACDDSEHARGLALRRAHRDEEARSLFQARWARTGEACAAARLGMAEADLSRWMDAEEHLSVALRARSDQWISAYRTRLQRALDDVRGHLCALQVETNASSGEVRVEARTFPLPLTEPIWVEPGRVSLVVRATGFRAGTQTVEVPAGRASLTVRVNVEPEPRDDPARSDAGAPGVGAALTVRDVSSGVTRRGTARTLGFIALGGAGLGLGLGFFGLLNRNDRASTFRDSGCWLNGSAVRGPGGCQDLYDEGSTMEGVSIGGFVSAGVFLLAGGVLLLTSRGTSESVPRRVSLSHPVGFGPPALSLAF